MRYIDVTLPIGPTMPIFPGDPPVELAPWSRRSSGAEFDVTALRLGTHTGTHVDAPAHCGDGPAVDALDLGIHCGAALVLDLSAAILGQPQIGASDLGHIPEGCSRLLLRTHAGEAYRPGTADGPSIGLDEDAARRLVTRGVRLVGIDRLSIATAGRDLAVHQVLLDAGVIILEGLDLAAIGQGTYELLCLPLRIAAGDGAPARAILIIP